MIRAIVFDCFGVLTSDAWREFVESLPENIDRQPVHSLNQAYGAGFISDEEFFEGVKELTDITPPITEHGSDVAKNTVLLDYIRELRGRGLRIGLLSNIAGNWIRDTFLTAEEQALFDEMVLSFEVGMVKPDPRIFRLMCEKLGVDTTEAVMVDDIARYCAAAETEGMKAVLYEDFQQARTDIEALLSGSAPETSRQSE